MEKLPFLQAIYLQCIHCLENSAAKKAKNMRKCLFTLQIESKYKKQKAHNRKNDVSN